jgi:hypothetical protein
LPEAISRSAARIESPVGDSRRARGASTAN